MASKQRKGGGPGNGGGPKPPDKKKNPKVFVNESPDKANPDRVRPNDVIKNVVLEPDRSRPGSYQFMIGTGDKQVTVSVPTMFLSADYHTSDDLAGSPVAVSVVQVERSGSGKPRIVGVLTNPDSTAANKGERDHYDKKGGRQYLEHVQATDFQFPPGHRFDSLDLQYGGQEGYSHIFTIEGGKKDDGTDAGVPGSKDGRGVHVVSFFGWTPPETAQDVYTTDVVLTRGHKEALYYEGQIPWQRELVMGYATNMADLARHERTMKDLTLNFERIKLSPKKKAEKQKRGKVLEAVLDTGQGVMDGFVQLNELVGKAEDADHPLDATQAPLNVSKTLADLEGNLARFERSVNRASVYLPTVAEREPKPMARMSQLKDNRDSALKVLRALLEKDRLAGGVMLDDDAITDLSDSMEEPFIWINGRDMAVAARGGAEYTQLLAALNVSAGVDPVLRFLPSGRKAGATPDWNVSTNGNHVAVLGKDHIVDLQVRHEGGKLRVVFDTVRARVRRKNIRTELAALLSADPVDEAAVDALITELDDLRPNNVDKDTFDRFAATSRFEVLKQSETEEAENLLQQLRTMPMEAIIRFLDARGEQIAGYTPADLVGKDNEALRAQVQEIITNRVRAYLGIAGTRVTLTESRYQHSGDGVHTYDIAVVDFNGDTVNRRIDVTGTAADADMLRKLGEMVTTATGAPPKRETGPEFAHHDPETLTVGQKGRIVDTVKFEENYGKHTPAPTKFEIVAGPRGAAHIKFGDVTMPILPLAYELLQNSGVIAVTEGPPQFEKHAAERIEDFCSHHDIRPPLLLGETLYYHGPATEQQIPGQPLYVVDVVNPGAREEKLILHYAAAYSKAGRANEKAKLSFGDVQNVDPDQHLAPRVVRALLDAPPGANMRLERTTNVDWFRSELERKHEIDGEALVAAMGLFEEEVRDGVVLHRFMIRRPEGDANVRIVQLDDSYAGKDGKLEPKGAVLIASENDRGEVVKEDWVPYPVLLYFHDNGLIEPAYILPDGDLPRNAFIDLVRDRGNIHPTELFENINKRGSRTFELRDAAGLQVQVTTVQNGLVAFRLTGDFALRTYTVEQFMQILNTPYEAETDGKGNPKKRPSNARLGLLRYPVRTDSAPPQTPELQRFVAPEPPSTGPGSFAPPPPAAPPSPRSSGSASGPGGFESISPAAEAGRTPLVRTRRSDEGAPTADWSTFDAVARSVFRTVQHIEDVRNRLPGFDVHHLNIIQQPGGVSFEVGDVASRGVMPAFLVVDAASGRARLIPDANRIEDPTADLFIGAGPNERYLSEATRLPEGVYTAGRFTLTKKGAFPAEPTTVGDVSGGWRSVPAGDVGGRATRSAPPTPDTGPPPSSTERVPPISRGAPDDAFRTQPFRGPRPVVEPPAAEPAPSESRPQQVPPLEIPPGQYSADEFIRDYVDSNRVRNDFIGWFLKPAFGEKKKAKKLLTGRRDELLSKLPQLEGILGQARWSKQQFEALRAAKGVAEDATYIAAVQRETRLAQEVKAVFDDIGRYRSSVSGATELLDELLPRFEQEATELAAEYQRIVSELA